MDQPIFEGLEPRLMLSSNGGDTDLDRDVDYNDLQTLQVNYGRTDANWADGDFNNDNVINVLDYIALKRNMGLENIISAVAENNELNVYGTDQDDVIDISQVGEDLVFNGEIFTGCDSIFVFTYGGQDIINIDYSVIKNTEIQAGDGNDKIYENGQCISNIYGGNGEDLIVSIGGGSDFIFGGNDKDSFWFDSSDSALDIEVSETDSKSVHNIIEFVSPYGTEEIVTLEINGQNYTDPATGYPYERDYSNYPLFGNGIDGIRYTDAQQGLIGDCYFIATLAAIAEVDTNVIYQSVTELGDGTYAIRFLNYTTSTEHYYRVDGDLPGRGYPVYARIRNNSLWVPILEKAYCHFRYSQNSYASISGGWMYSVMKQITETTTTSFWISSKVEDDIISFITESLDKEYAITASTSSVATSPTVANHAYVILDLYTSGEITYIKLYNPWGSSLNISISTFMNNFSMIVTCNF